LLDDSYRLQKQQLTGTLRSRCLGVKCWTRSITTTRWAARQRLATSSHSLHFCLCYYLGIVRLWPCRLTRTCIV